MTAIDEKYAALGGSGGWLGSPTGSESPTPDGRGAFAHYAHGSIYWSSSTGAHVVGGAIRQRWLRTGWERGPLGFPVTDESDADGGGRFNHFQRGSIYWSPSTGAHEVHGAIHGHWRASGWERGPLGFPTTDETATPDGEARWSRFQRGQIYWTPSGGARTESAPLVTRRPWAVILCKHADIPAEPRPAHDFWNLFTERGASTGGLYDYWRDLTYGTVDFDGSVVVGWYTLPHTLATDIEWRDTLPAPVSRARRIDAGIQAAVAAAEIDLTQFDGICVILNGVVDTGSLGRQPRTLNGRTKSYGLAVLDPLGWRPTTAAHEVGHGLGLPHTFADTAPPTEYGDRWDIMSAMNVSSYETAPYGTSGPGLCAAYRMALGAMAADRVFVAGASGRRSETVTVTALDSPQLPGPLVVKVPVLPGDPTHFFTVEVRRKVGWDRGIPDDVVLIHEVRGSIATLIQTGAGPEFTPGEEFRHSSSGVTIAVSNSAAPIGKAVVAVTT